MSWRVAIECQRHARLAAKADHEDRPLKGHTTVHLAMAALFQPHPTTQTAG